MACIDPPPQACSRGPVARLTFALPFHVRSRQRAPARPAPHPPRARRSPCLRPQPHKQQQAGHSRQQTGPLTPGGAPLRPRARLQPSPKAAATSPSRAPRWTAAGQKSPPGALCKCRKFGPILWPCLLALMSSRRPRRLAPAPGGGPSHAAAPARFARAAWAFPWPAARSGAGAPPRFHVTIVTFVAFRDSGSAPPALARRAERGHRRRTQEDSPPP